MSGSKQGTLFIVATPIGNLSDLSDRAREVLSAVDCILAEDTRHSGRLLKHLGISKPLKAYHDHNEREISSKIVQALLQGDDYALISDAGTPLINDPGYQLVVAAKEQQISVVPIPGPCAITTALSASGLPTERFEFVGFPPSKRTERQTWLQDLSTLKHTVIFYEAPHRIIDTIQGAMEQFGEQRLACIAKELTKRYEQIKRGSLQQLYDWLISDSARPRGEYVVLIEGIKIAECIGDEHEARRILAILLETVSTKEASMIAARISGMKKNDLYQLALELNGKTVNQ